jgi:outer membrane protein
MRISSISRKLLLLSIMSVFWNCFQADGQNNYRQISLDEAIRIARAFSPDALIAKQNYSNSYWAYRSYQASNLPSLKLSSTLPKIYQSIDPHVDDSGYQTFVSTKYINADANLALSQKIGITGGSISLNSSLNWYHNANFSNPAPFTSTPVNIRFDQPLFQFNQYKWDRKLEPLKFAQAKRKFIEDMEQVSITATNNFFTLLQAQVEKKISLANLSNYDTLYHIAKGRYQLGKIAENDLLQLELNFLKAQAAVENADLALDNAQFQFKSFLRLQDSADITLMPPGNIQFFRIDPQQAVKLANENSSAVLGFKKRLLEAASTVNEAKLKGRFDANLTAIIGLQQNAATIPKAYVNPGDQRQFGLDLSIPIVDWGVTHGKIKMAQSQEDIEKNMVEQETIDFQRNVYLKAVLFNMQQNQLAIAAKSDTVARKSYEVIKNRYYIGKINSILDLNNAQIETDNSEKNYYATLQTFWRSYYEIRKLTLFDFRKNEPLKFDLKDYK